MASGKNIVWVESHAMNELKAVRSRKMSMFHATIINTIARKLAVERYLTTFPLVVRPKEHQMLISRAWRTWFGT